MMLFTRATLLLLLPLLLFSIPSHANKIGLLRKDMTKIFESSPSSDRRNMTEFGNIFFENIHEYDLKLESSLRNEFSLSFSLSMSMNVDSSTMIVNASATKVMAVASGVMVILPVVDEDTNPRQIIDESQSILPSSLKGGDTEYSGETTTTFTLLSTKILLVMTSVVLAYWW